MLVFPYDAVICRAHQIKPVEKELKRAQIEHPLPVLTTPMGNVIKDGLMVTPKEEYDDVPRFTQIITLETGKSRKFVIDARPYMRWDRQNDTYKLTAESDFGFQCNRAALTQLLAEDGITAFHRFGDVPAKTFIRWVTLGVSQRFQLPIDVQMTLMVISAYYYFTCFEPERKLDLDSKVMLAQRVSRITSVPQPLVLEIADKLPQMSDAEQFAFAIKEHSGSIRLGDIRFVDLFTILAPSWVGVNARENCGVALEHLPTFIAMTYSALGDRSYRKTLMTKRAETAGRQNDMKVFVDQVYRQIESRFI